MGKCRIFERSVCRQKGQNPNGTKLRASGSKFSNIREQNQNWPNLKGIQYILVQNLLKQMTEFGYKSVCSQLAITHYVATNKIIHVY